MYFMHQFLSYYEGKVESSRPSLRETLVRTRTGAGVTATLRVLIKLFWLQPMAQWALAAAYGQGKKSST